MISIISSRLNSFNTQGKNLLFSNESVVIFLGHVNCELIIVFGWRHALGHGANHVDWNAALNLLLVDIVDGLVRDYQGAFLGPSEHIYFFYFACIQKDVWAG